MKNFENPTYDYGGKSNSDAATLFTQSLGVESQYSLACSPTITDEVYYSAPDRNSSNNDENVYYSEPRESTAIRDSVYYSQPKESAVKEATYHSVAQEPQGKEPVYHSKAGPEKSTDQEPNRESIYYSLARQSSDGTSIYYSSPPDDDHALIDDSGEYAYADTRSILRARTTNSVESQVDSCSLVPNGHYEMDPNFSNTLESNFYHEVEPSNRHVNQDTTK